MDEIVLAQPDTNIKTIMGVYEAFGRGDVAAMETPGGISNSQAPGWLNRLQTRYWTGPPHPVARASRPQLKLPDARGSALTVT